MIKLKYVGKQNDLHPETAQVVFPESVVEFSTETFATSALASGKYLEFKDEKVEPKAEEEKSSKKQGKNKSL